MWKDLVDNLEGLVYAQREGTYAQVINKFK